MRRVENNLIMIVIIWCAANNNIMVIVEPSEGTDTGAFFSGLSSLCGLRDLRHCQKGYILFYLAIKQTQAEMCSRC